MTRRSILVLITAIALSLVSACAATNSSTQTVRLASEASLPAEIRGAPWRVREAYRFAAVNPEALKNVPCYCGCGPIGHTSNYACYVQGSRPEGALIFDQHALGCSICVDITQDVMRLTREGKQASEIRQFVVAAYSRFGPPNQ